MVPSKYIKLNQNEFVVPFTSYTIYNIENARYIFRPTLVLVKSENEIHNSNQILTNNTTTSKFQVLNDNNNN